MILNHSQLQLASILHGLLTVHQNAPALRASTSFSIDNSLKGAVFQGELEDLIIKSARLKPDSRNSNALGLLEDVDGDARVGDDGD